MSEWTSIEPTTPGWYWVISESNFCYATPIEIRILKIHSLREKSTKIQWWNPKKGNWEYANKVQKWQPVDNVPFDNER